MPRFAGECECPQCGCGSKDLVMNALPIIVAEFGDSTKLHCDICGHEWLHKRVPLAQEVQQHA